MLGRTSAWLRRTPRRAWASSCWWKGRPEGPAATGYGQHSEGEHPHGEGILAHRDAQTDGLVGIEGVQVPEECAERPGQVLPLLRDELFDAAEEKKNLASY